MLFNSYEFIFLTSDREAAGVWQRACPADAR
jgi:hypothetical protein